MSALGYLFLTRIKNGLKQLFKSPAKLILTLAMLAMLALVIVSSLLSNDELAPRDAGELHAMIFALYFMVMLSTAMTGLASGATFYTMPDVNLVFTAPITPLRVLLYGLLRQMGTSLYVGALLLFQFSWLHQLYGLTLGGLLLILLGYALILFCAQICAMALYAYTSSDEGRQRIARLGLYLLAGLVVALVVLPLLRQPGNPLGAMLAGVNQLAIDWIPVAGWMRAAAVGALAGQWITAVGYTVLTLAFCGGLIALMLRSHTDYYEDVLKATEVSYSAITAKKEGKLQEAVPQRVRLGKVGLESGEGASVFYYKHRLENRRSRVFLLDSTTLLMGAMSVVFAFFMRDVGIVAAFSFATYMQIFSSFTGRWLRELILPYVYLIPEPPFRKLLMICRESVEKAVVEAIVVMLPIGLIVGASPALILVLILARLSFGLLLIAANLMTERLLGSVLSKTLQVFLFFVFLILIALPGIVGGILLGIFLPAGMGLPAAFGVIALWNAGASLLVAYLSRNILSLAELNNK